MFEDTKNKIKYLALIILVLGFTVVFASETNVSNPMLKSNGEKNTPAYTYSVHAKILNNNLPITNNTTTYIRYLQRTLFTRMNFKNYKSDQNLKTVAQFRLNSNGTTAYPKIVQSSGDKNFDNNVLNGIKALRLEPVPNDFKKSYLDMQVSVKYEVTQVQRVYKRELK